mgnify:CR=1 FL=1
MIEQVAATEATSAQARASGSGASYLVDLAKELDGHVVGGARLGDSREVQRVRGQLDVLAHSVIDIDLDVNQIASLCPTKVSEKSTVVRRETDHEGERSSESKCHVIRRNEAHSSSSNGTRW